MSKPLKITAPIYFEGMAIHRLEGEGDDLRAMARSTVRVNPRAAMDLMRAKVNGEVELFFGNYPESKLFKGDTLTIVGEENSQWSKHHEVEIEGELTGLSPKQLRSIKELQEEYTATQEKVKRLQGEIDAQVAQREEAKGGILQYKEFRLGRPE